MGEAFDPGPLLPQARQTTDMTPSSHHPEDLDPLPLLGAAFSEALDGIDIPGYILDAAGRLRWANLAAIRLVGDRRGQLYLSFVADDARDRAKDHFARKIVGGLPTSYEVAVLDRAGQRVPLRISAAPLRDGRRVVGIFGLAVPVSDGLAIAADSNRPLTRRQIEILRLLADGLSTQGISSELGIAVETVRNHIRALLRRLGVHSRLEAVAEARRQGLLRGRADG
jgi:DNA-binding NarL/FixJ family response regulator